MIFGRNDLIRSFLEEKDNLGDLVLFGMIFEENIPIILHNLVESCKALPTTEKLKQKAIGISFISDIIEVIVRVHLDISDKDPLPQERVILIEKTIAEAIYPIPTYSNRMRYMRTRPFQQQSIPPQDLDI